MNNKASRFDVDGKPLGEFDVADPYKYISGFGGFKESEALPDTLPVGQNSPLNPAHGLYTEKFSGSAFTAPRHENLQTWLYRILPSSSQPTHKESPIQPFDSLDSLVFSPNQNRWPPFPSTITDSTEPGQDTFPYGLKLVCGNGNPTTKDGFAIYTYGFTGDMHEHKQAFSSSDGDLLILPRTGDLNIHTELGNLYVRPNELVLLPRGLKFSISSHLSSVIPAAGYCLELFQGHFTLPSLGAIGSSGLANPRDFLTPVASFDSSPTPDWTLLTKFSQRLWLSSKPSPTPFNVVAWHGSYYPYKYALTKFSPIGALLFDHPDPSIFTVLTAPATTPGTGVVDFAIFSERWLVGENTFRPPWFHRNNMSEFMGLLGGEYDGKAKGFLPGGGSLHNCMSGHGPDKGAFEKEYERDTEDAVKVGEQGIAFMWESERVMGVSPWALETQEEAYVEESWGALERKFVMPSGVKSSVGFGTGKKGDFGADF
ncbi:Homogentisate 1,2-dioxygenase [Ascobolus immersus RN42]|uniref:homogentisate 1,2-dioxygenase n=1 Tax=Ascobolus immersus RN42 TaxID=1160509 RepID=A0A3N4I3A9_ASCIM|nr:Homogentisate 1,2-dioxygenase [Ascobolus immersus RN42]